MKRNNIRKCCKPDIRKSHYWDKATGEKIPAVILGTNCEIQQMVCCEIEETCPSHEKENNDRQ